jgi:transcription antitermination factor NusG
MSEVVWRGCLFCKTGKEAEVIMKFQYLFPDGRAITPTRTRFRRKGETVKEEKVSLLPGYVFFELTGRDILETESAFSHTEFRLQRLTRDDNVYKLLRYADGRWQLHGFDDRFAGKLFETEGNIDVSQAWFDKGKRIRILSGFLKDYEGAITRVNKKTKTVEVQIDLQGKKAIMWLGYELVEPMEE